VCKTFCVTWALFESNFFLIATKLILSCSNRWTPLVPQLFWLDSVHPHLRLKLLALKVKEQLSTSLIFHTGKNTNSTFFLTFQRRVSVCSLNPKKSTRNCFILTFNFLKKINHIYCNEGHSAKRHCHCLTFKFNLQPGKNTFFMLVNYYI